MNIAEVIVLEEPNQDGMVSVARLSYRTIQDSFPNKPLEKYSLPGGLSSRGQKQKVYIVQQEVHWEKLSVLPENWKGQKQVRPRQLGPLKDAIGMQNSTKKSSRPYRKG